MPFAPEQIVTYVVDFLQKAHGSNEPYSVRDGINITRMVLKLGISRETIPSVEQTDIELVDVRLDESKLRELLHDAVMGILGDNALRYLT